MVIGSAAMYGVFDANNEEFPIGRRRIDIVRLCDCGKFDRFRAEFNVGDLRDITGSDSGGLVMFGGALCFLAGSNCGSVGLPDRWRAGQGNCGL